jgi:hypothetical protein
MSTAVGPTGDRGFEAGSLQQRVSCEPEDDIDICAFVAVSLTSTRHQGSAVLEVLPRDADWREILAPDINQQASAVAG